MMYKVTVELWVEAEDESGAKRYVSDGLERGIPENDECMGWTIKCPERSDL